jgi:hypothetical protein
MAQQAIRQWVKRVIGENKSDEAYRILNSARNHLLHGGSRDSLEGKVKVSTDEIINVAAHVAWRMIYSCLPLRDQITFFERGGDFNNKSLIFAANLRFTHTGPEEHPAEDTIPRPELSMMTSFQAPLDKQT